MIVFLNEGDHVTGFTTPEALIHASFEVDVERWSFLFVEGAEANVATSSLLKLYVFANDIYNVSLGTDLVDDMVGDARHWLKSQHSIFLYLALVFADSEELSH